MQLDILQASPFTGPTPRPAVVTQFPKQDQPRQVTVRLLAPDFYRKHISSVQDTPQTVITSLTTTLGCQIARLTGGNWSVVTHPHGRILIGHLEMDVQLAEQLVAHSGKQALFAAIISKSAKQDPVAWLPRNKLSSEDYFRQSLTQAQAKKAPLVLRQGGASDLGLAGIAQTEVCAVCTWEAHGCPRFWTAEDMYQFLNQSNWTEVQILNKVRRGSQFPWMFKAKAAPAQNLSQPNFWSYTNEAQTLHLTVAQVQPRQRKPVPTERVAPPRKRWVDLVPAKAPSPPDDDVEVVLTAAPTENKERSPRRLHGKKPDKPDQDKVVLDPDRVFTTQNPGWKILNNGGNGDCAFRSVACGIGTAQKKSLSGDALVRAASKLRTLAVGHLIKHANRFKQSWAVDETEEPYLRDYQEVPQDFSDWCMIASRQGYYADGMMLQALAERLACPIIVFAWDATMQSWVRAVQASKFVDGVAQVDKREPPL